MKYLFTLFLLASLASGGLAQYKISIETGDFVAVLNEKNSMQNFTTPYSALNPAVLASYIGKGDTNQIWDFNIASYIREPMVGVDSIIGYSDTANAPLVKDPDFTSAFEIIMVTTPNAPTQYGFYGFTSVGVLEMGTTQDSAGVETKIVGWNPPILEAAIPMKYGNTWQSTSKVSGISVLPGERRYLAITSVVDGWGTLKLPGSYPLPALRVKKQIVVTDTVSQESITTDTSYQYIFYTNNFLDATINTDARNVVQSAEYAGPPISAGVTGTSDDGSAFIITQNPASNAATKIIFSIKNDGLVQVELMDMLGNQVRVLQNERISAGEYSIQLDPRSLPSGAYFVRLISPEMTAMKKLIISR